MEINEEILQSKTFHVSQLSVDAKMTLIEQNNLTNNPDLLNDIQVSLNQDLQSIAGLKGLHRLGYKSTESGDLFRIEPNLQSWFTTVFGTIVGFIMMYFTAPKVVASFFIPGVADFNIFFIVGTVIQSLIAYAGFRYALSSLDNLVRNVSFHINSENGSIKYSINDNLKSTSGHIYSPEQLVITQNGRISVLSVKEDENLIPLLKGSSTIHEQILINVKNHFSDYLNN